MTEVKKPRYTVSIDDEGYPMFDGLRVNDHTLVNILLSNIERIEHEGLEEIDGALNPVQSFLRSKTYKEEW